MLNNDSVLTDILGTAINPQGPSVCVPNNDSVDNVTDTLGTAINPQGPNATTDEPTMIIVTAVVYDAIVLNIPDTLNISLIDRIKALIQWEASASDSTQTKPPIIFIAPIMASRSLGQQQIVTIPQENITAIEKGLTYFVKVSDQWPCMLILTQYIIIYNRLNLFL